LLDGGKLEFMAPPEEFLDAHTPVAQAFLQTLPREMGRRQGM